MKNQLAIVAWDAEGRVVKYQDYDTAKEASAHVARVEARWPQAFAAVHPGGGPRDWRVAGGALTLDPAPEPAPEDPAPSAAEALAELLIEEGVITRQKWEGKQPAAPTRAPQR